MQLKKSEEKSFTPPRLLKIFAFTFSLQPNVTLGSYFTKKYGPMSTALYSFRINKLINSVIF